MRKLIKFIIGLGLPEIVMNGLSNVLFTISRADSFSENFNNALYVSLNKIPKKP